MKILLAPDKFKGSLSAMEVAIAIAQGLQQQQSEIDIMLHPLADGGDGSLNILSEYIDFEQIELIVNDPLSRPIKSYYLRSEESAFIEMAMASGMELLDAAERNPLLTSTYGTGQMVKHAIENNCKEIYLFLGGSATNDAGLGIAAALGFHFYDKEKNAVTPLGENLRFIKTFDSSQSIDCSQVEFQLISDVQNPLFGPTGAAHVYAAQKGADEEAIEILDQGLRNIGAFVLSKNGIDLQKIPGTGAAGGVAAAMVGLFDAKIKSGIQAIMSWTNFEALLKEADIVISGEGKLDQQSLAGKVVHGVSQLCQQYKKPLYLFVGKNDLSSNHNWEVLEVMSLARNEQDAMENAMTHLNQLGYQLAQKIL